MGNITIPVHARGKAKESLEKELEKIEWEDSPGELIQERYDKLMKVLESIGKNFGKNKNSFRTDDKLFPGTKDLILKRQELKSKISHLKIR